MPLSHRSFSPIKYLDWSNRSSQRRQKAKVPKFWLMTFNSCFDLASLKKENRFWRISMLLFDQVCVQTSSLPQWDMANIPIFHVMRCFHIVMNIATTGRTECFNGIKFILLHFGRFTTADNRHSFSSVNSYIWRKIVALYLLKKYLSKSESTVWSNRVSVQIANRFDLVGLAVDFNFIRFHHFLNSCSNVAEPNIYTRFPNSSVCGIPNCL